MRTHHTFCRICEALCGLEVDVEDGRVAAVRPDDQHVTTRGFACIKGLQQHHMYRSPDRLTQPLRRVGRRFEPVSWPDALAEIGARVRALRGVDPDAIAMYIGTAAGFSVLHPIFAQGFMQGVGSRNMFSTASQDCANKFAVATHMYGFPFSQPYPDVDHTECLIVVGANPVVSKWSFLQVSNPAQRLKDIERRGGRLFIVDPRKTETAKVAGEHVFIRPGTDVFFYLAFLHELLARDAIDHDGVARHMKNFALLPPLAAPWTPERAARVTGIAPEVLREMVSAYVQADGASIYCSTGVNMGPHGGLAFWIQEAINAITGNLDRRGGALVGHGIVDFAKLGKKYGVLLRKDRTRVGGFPSVNDTFPGGVLADEILTPGRKKIRALFVTGGNPLLAMANSERLRAAFKQLELLVVLDIFRNDTAELADFVLPTTAPFQRPDLPFLFPLLLGLQSRPYLQATRAVVPPEGEQRDEATIYLELARACGVPLFGSRVAHGLLSLAQRWRGWRLGESLPSVPQERLLSLLLRVTGHGSFQRLLAHRHGWSQPRHPGSDFLGARVVTDDGRVDLAPAPLVAQAEGLEAAFGRAVEAPAGLKLITRRAVTSHNTWTHNHPRFVRGSRGTNYLYMHSEDAAQRGLSSGDLADVRTTTGEVRVPVQLLDDLMPGTVALPHGWGHQRSEGLSTASQTSGVNVNLLAPDGPAAVDPISGMVQLTGLDVEVSPARGPQDPRRWSGLPAEN